MNSPVKKQETTFGFALQDVARLMRRNFNRNVCDLGLTQAQWQALVYIMYNPGLRQSQLADILEMQPISVGRLIDRMVEAGLVERTPDAADRRAVNLHLAEKAQPVLDAMRTRAAKARMKALAGITDEEQETLLRILLRMRENLIDTPAKG